MPPSHYTLPLHLLEPFVVRVVAPSSRHLPVISVVPVAAADPLPIRTNSAEEERTLSVRE